MKLCLLLALVQITSLVSGTPKLDGRIIGGALANISYFPYQVSIKYFGLHICGGAIIHDLHILTAAHCVEEAFAVSLKVQAGSADTRRGGVTRNVCAIHMHGKYNKTKEDYDIAILRLCTRLPFQNTILPIALPIQNEKIASGTSAVVSGWGFLKEDGNTVDLLRQVQIRIISQEKCKRFYKPDEVTPRMLCAGVLVGGKDACQGDSGGPLLAAGKLFGIVSWGEGCARPNYPGVYTRVSKFINWINKIVKFYNG